MAAPETHSDPDNLILHASCVALQSRAVLITGASGSGKSALALTLMAGGAALIADDRTLVRVSGSDILADCPPQIRGRIEARGIGILHAEPAVATPVWLIVDLDQVETRRLPEPRDRMLLGRRIPLLHKVESPHFAPAILHYLKTGQDPER